MRQLAATILMVALGSAHAQQLARTCLPGNDLANGLELRVDGAGILHLTRVARVSGNLLYTRIGPDGVAVDEQIEARISRLAVDEVTDTGLLVDEQAVMTCYYSAADKRFKVATRQGDGSWDRVVLATGDGVGRTCDIVRYKGDPFVAWYEAGSLRVATRAGGVWQPLDADTPDARDVGHAPSIALGPANAIAIAHFDATREVLRVSSLDGVWQSEDVAAAAIGTGWRPAAVFSQAGELFVYHGGLPSAPDVSADVLLFESRGIPGAGFVSGQLQGVNIGGSLDAVASGPLTTVFTRQRQRSALFGDADALRMYRGVTGGGLELTPLEVAGANERRHAYQYLQVAHDPFHLPVFAFLDDASAFFNQPASALVCFYRPLDRDADGLPDEVEARLGTRPDDPDTDGDGRTDGEEVLVDGTDPGGGPDCVEAAETCDGADEDCDGVVDEDLSRECYPAHPDTRGVGRCRPGVVTCVAGEFGACQAAITPRDEVCDLRDDDCDGQVDEDDPGGGAPCETGGLGRCALGQVTCVAGRLDCVQVGQEADETCNLDDDDCDGEVDEGTQACGEGVCRRVVSLCTDDGEDIACLPFEAPRADDQCDGVDDDCDGATDEHFPNERTQCGEGACTRLGEQQCVVGRQVDTCIPGRPAADDATCDGVDDDCDGAQDEDFPQGVISCGIGACRRQGLGQCVEARQVGDCTPGEAGVEGAACDGVDQDCDGRADEDFVSERVPCGEGACTAAGNRTCEGGVVGDDCVPLQPGANDAACDGVDEDCDGAVDEDFRARPVFCGRGACIVEGRVDCVDGGQVEVCVAGAPAADDDTCDGVDDDCDGRADEDHVAERVACGVGACASEGERRCVDGAVVNDCDPPDGVGPDDDCDGTDQDCDGAVDEAYVPRATGCGVGACASRGELRCIDDEPVDSCRAGEAAADDATCDGVDDDCDAVADEDFVVEASRCGTGACAAVGETRCVRGELADTCDAGEPAVGDRSCDGRDDDCDGEVDEDFRTRRTFCGVGACAALGEAVCEAGEVVDTCAEAADPAPDDATCDLVDEDCDGTSDEDYVAPGTVCGVGACAREGLDVCERGQVRDTCDPGRPADDDRTCDAIDADCDGADDEDYAPQETTCGVGACAAVGATFCEAGDVGDTCTPGEPAEVDATCDGVDDDCDGVADEDYPVSDTACGVGACVAQGALVCRGGEEVDTCEPGAPGPDDRACDGVDADCDGTSDEDYEPQRTTCGVGACEAEGDTFCEAGEVGDTCVPDEPAADDATCDGVDDDCDARNDEDHVRRPTDCGQGACAADGEVVCVLGEERSTCVPADAVADDDATCDATDDDCDGRTDEDYAETPTECGEGNCARQGSVVCDDGAPRDNCQPRRPRLQDATCDGRDDDCDDALDEDYQVRGVRCSDGVCVSQGTTSCDEGVETNDCVPGAVQGDDDDCDLVDQDCDGTADEHYPVERTECGVGGCVAVGERRCQVGQALDTCEVGGAALQDATCDGRDDDCDGASDEDFQAVPTECGLGVCAAAGERTCEAGEAVDSCVTGQRTGDDSSCDRTDDDCDGETDEAFPRRGTACGVGACASQGESGCELGRARDSCEPGRPGLTDETCDGVDDDCDGFVDEDFQERNEVCGEGACRSEGAVLCNAGVSENTCVPGAPADADATCDATDDDCDGELDEDYVATGTTCGEGVCARAGERRCVNGAENDGCVPGAAAGPDSVCDGLDADCDGATDEGFVRRVVRCGVGACRRAGELACVDGEAADDCVAAEPAADDATCDRVDDDCDGERDEDYVPVGITCGTGVCEASGQRVCVGGVETDACEPQPPGDADATCDGLDDDCDGALDEDFAGAVTCGVGACEVVGSQGCVGGERVDDCTPGVPTDDDTCDGVDDDCDTLLDEAYTPQGVSCGVGACVSVGVGQCADAVVVSDCVAGAPAETDATCDAVDDDCDGVADEDYAAAALEAGCGVGACFRGAETACAGGEVGEACEPGQPADIDLACDEVDEDCDGVVDEGCDPDFVPPDAGVDPDDGVPQPDQGAPDPDDGVPPPDQGAPDPDDGIPPDGGDREVTVEGDAAVDPDDRVPRDADTEGGPDAADPDTAVSKPVDAGPDAEADACVGAECPVRPRVRKPVSDEPINCSCDSTQPPGAPYLLLLLGLRRRRPGRS